MPECIRRDVSSAETDTVAFVIIGVPVRKMRSGTIRLELDGFVGVGDGAVGVAVVAVGTPRQTWASAA